MGISEIQTRIRDEHAELRSRLQAVDSLLCQFETGNAQAALALRERGLELYERLGRHVDLEESLLVPALREQGGERGLRSADQLIHEHHEQRELLRYLTGRLAGARLPSLLIARELEAFSECLTMDMAHEETTLLPSLTEIGPAAARVEATR